MKKLILLLAIVGFAFAANAQDTKKEGEKEKSTTEQKASQEKVYYQCTMHPDEKSDKPGKCSKCGMDLKKVTVKTTETKKEQEKFIYQCPMHPDEKSDKPGKCSKCGMALEKVKPE